MSAMKVALITGIAGQDGSYLAEHLLNLGYEVKGLIRRNSVPEHQETRIKHLESEVELYYSDLIDSGNLIRIIDKVNPTHIFNLAAQSHVRISFDIPLFTVQTNTVGPLNLLEILRDRHPNIRYYQASSSEMFGDSVDPDGFQRETTPMNPVSPYGSSKLCAYNLTRIYRDSYALHATNGILFNHESPRRGSNFVTSKIIKSAVEIKLGLREELVMGNLDSFRDWGHSKDYVAAMEMIINHSIPDDFVVATGISKSVRDLVALVFGILSLDYERYVRQDSRFFRPKELPYLKGDSSKIRKLLKWEPKISFEEMVEEMVQSWLKELTPRS